MSGYLNGWMIDYRNGPISVESWSSSTTRSGCGWHQRSLNPQLDNVRSPTMNRSKLILASMFTLLTSTSVSATDAGSLAMAWMFGYGGWHQRPMVMNNYNPPYFSMHPPVYYGDRYYRPYGDSPFASWPQLQPNPNYQPSLGARNSMSLTIENPHCNLQAAPSGSTARPEVVYHPDPPLTIDNPYFEAAQSKFTATGR